MFHRKLLHYKGNMAQIQDSFEVQLLGKGPYKEYWVNSTENHTEGTGVAGRVLEFLKAQDAKAVSIRLFGSHSDIEDALRLIEMQTEEVGVLPLCILQDDSTGHAPLDIQVHAISGANLKPLYFEDVPVGHEFEDAHAKYYMLNVLPNDGEASKCDQTNDIFERSHAILEGLGLNFSDTIRTWLFVQDILSWYGDLNETRDRFFERHDIFNKLVPASTGIGVMNLQNKALVTNVLAVIPKTSETTMEPVASPLQNPALDYKSSFSRAVKVSTPDYGRLYISGTASIEKSGDTVFLDDTAAQIEMTMQVVHAILNNADMDWSDTVTALAYFKYRKDFGLFDDYCRANGIKIPHIKIHADVCRDDLLFELELDAMSKNAT